MAEQKYKSPEELGEAVGRKIEELFGAAFGDEGPAKSGTEYSQEEAGRIETTVPEAATQPAQGADPREMQLKAPEEPQSLAQPGKGKPHADSYEEILDRIEALILNLEWEVSPESVKEIFQKFIELDHFFPEGNLARTILAMNRRVLPRFKSPDATPHPALLKLLQDSVAALKSLIPSQKKPPPDRTLVGAITKSYKEIMASPVSVGILQPSAQEPAEKNGLPVHASLVERVGGAVRSLEDISKRMGRIQGVLRQGGSMTPEEITRRLGTLEHLLSERVAQLVSLHNELARIPADTIGSGTEKLSPSRDGQTGPDGILLAVWGTVPLAIPSSVVSAMYLLTKVQAQQLVAKSSINLGSHPIQRLPLKKPQAVEKKETLPAWLVHLSWAEKDFFVLVDRLLGYRRAPEGTDIMRDTRIKIGPTAFNLINQAIFR